MYDLEYHTFACCKTYLRNVLYVSISKNNILRIYTDQLTRVNDILISSAIVTNSFYLFFRKKFNDEVLGSLFVAEKSIIWDQKTRNSFKAKFQRKNN